MRASLTWDNRAENQRFDLDLYLVAPGMERAEERRLRKVYHGSREVGNWKLDLDFTRSPGLAAENIFWNTKAWVPPVVEDVFEAQAKGDTECLELINNPPLPTEGEYKVWVENYVNDAAAAEAKLAKQYQLKVEVDGQPVTLYREMISGTNQHLRVKAEDETVQDKLEAFEELRLYAHGQSYGNNPKHVYYFSYDPTAARSMRARYVDMLKQYAALQKKMSDLQQ